MRRTNLRYERSPADDLPRPEHLRNPGKSIRQWDGTRSLGTYRDFIMAQGSSCSTCRVRGNTTSMKIAAMISEYSPLQVLLRVECGRERVDVARPSVETRNGNGNKRAKTTLWFPIHSGVDHKDQSSYRKTASTAKHQNFSATCWLNESDVENATKAPGPYLRGD